MGPAAQNKCCFKIKFHNLVFQKHVAHWLILFWYKNVSILISRKGEIPQKNRRVCAIILIKSAN